MYKSGVGMKNKYRCGACNWKFTRNFEPNFCPYCGKNAVGEDITRAADELLREVS